LGFVREFSIAAGRSQFQFSVFAMAEEHILIRTGPGEGKSARIDMKLSLREVSHVSVVDITGRITLGDETGQLRDTVANLIGQKKMKILLNLAGVDYIDSSGVGELVSSFITVRNAGGDLKLLNLTPKVNDILNVMKLYTVFDIRDDEFTAVKSFDYFFAK
jgi:anti-sigma B factor antagonist